MILNVFNQDEPVSQPLEDVGGILYSFNKTISSISNFLSIGFFCKKFWNSITRVSIYLLSSILISNSNFLFKYFYFVKVKDTYHSWRSQAPNERL